MTGSLGFLLATVPFSKWFDLVGWREPFLIMGILLCLNGLILYFVLVKTPKQTIIKKATATKEREKTLPMLQRIFSNRQAWATFLCHFGLVGTYIGFIGSWAVPFGMNTYGLTRSDASQLIMIGLFGAIFGAPLTSWISNRMESIRRTYIVVHIVVIISWVVFLLYHGKPPYYLLFILFFLIGYGNGASTLTFAVVRKSFSMREVGVVSGFANTGGFISAILLPIFFGHILDQFRDSGSEVGYKYGFIIPVIFTIMGLVGGLLIKEQRQEAKQLST
jgi:nitrate/nitrite transporter NarK